jgi:hypothetical protein
MTDYFSEYSSFVGKQGLPSPADTPYETPSYLRSKRSSRATAGSSREQSASPPPLPPSTTDFQENSKDGRYSALDPRRFTPTLHASLVSEILNLRRELDSKNDLVENLETSLSSAKTENETLTQQVAQHAKDVRKAKQQVQQMEQGAYDVVENLVKERDAAVQNAEELKTKLDEEKKKARRQDEDSMRTQGIWESEKESWENERRQLERRIHVTENRLRTFVDEVSAQQVALETHPVQIDEVGDEGTFKDSGIGNESDTASIRSLTPKRHRRNVSSVSFRTRSIRRSTSTRASILSTPEPHAKPEGHSLADELGIDEEDEFDVDEFEHGDDELEYPSPRRRTVESRQGFHDAAEVDAKAKRVLGLTSETPDSPAGGPTAPTGRQTPKQSWELPPSHEPSKVAAGLPPVVTEEEVAPPKVQYVDTGYQPSPPPSPQSKATSTDPLPTLTISEPKAAEGLVAVQTEPHVARPALGALARVAGSPISPPETPVGDGVAWPEEKRESTSAPSYSDASAQTDFPEPERPKSHHTPKRDSLSPPSFVPSIAIHPPTSRPSSPRSYVLPPGTKNASAQTNLPWPGKDASVQTEEIRVDARLRKLPSHLLPSRVETKSPEPQYHAMPLLPSPTFPDHAMPRRAPNVGGTAKIFTKMPAAPSFSSPPLQSPIESSPDTPRDGPPRRPHHQRNMPLRAIPLPRPVLAPAQGQADYSDNGPLNRSSQYGVTRPLQSTTQLLDIDKDSDYSDYEDPISDVDGKDPTGTIPGINKAPHGRFGLSEPPKMVPEDKEISPERRPDTAGSYGAAPAPSVASSRANSTRAGPSKPRPNKAGHYRSRSPSFGSFGSSSYSTSSALPMPPYPIPRRSSSRYPPPKTLSDGSQSPTTANGDVFERDSHRSSHSYVRSNNLRKVQSAAVIRNSRSRNSPQKHRRRRKSPDLTPVQSMAFDTPNPATNFPIPELPTPLQERSNFQHLVKGSVDLSSKAPPSTAATSEPQSTEETTLVDAIAATMVGEWMWKYIRKRKSFGIGEETSEYQQDGMTGAVNVAAHGTRHKRWVWLSPYERTIMWDNRQPTSGPALLGKKGRKCECRNIPSILGITD